MISPYQTICACGGRPRFAIAPRSLDAGELDAGILAAVDGKPMADAGKQKSPAELMSEDPCGPSIWNSATGAQVPADAWEYHMRAALRDAAFTNLRYRPYCSTMPVQKDCQDPRFMWTKK